MVNRVCPRVVVCPNPGCHRKIDEPTLLNNLSTSPAEQYYVCPLCFTKLTAYPARANLAGPLLATFGLIILAWVGWLTVHELTMWGKEITLIFFSSRTGEALALGIGMKVIYYFLIGLVLLIVGLFTFLRRRSTAIEIHPSATAPEKEESSSKCPYNFGYLKMHESQNIPIPKDCLRCSRIMECSRSNE